MRKGALGGEGSTPRCLESITEHLLCSGLGFNFGFRRRHVAKNRIAFVHLFLLYAEPWGSGLAGATSLSGWIGSSGGVTLN